MLGINGLMVINGCWTPSTLNKRCKCYIHIIISLRLVVPAKTVDRYLEVAAATCMGPAGGVNVGEIINSTS